MDGGVTQAVEYLCEALSSNPRTTTKTNKQTKKAFRDLVPHILISYGKNGLPVLTIYDYLTIYESTGVHPQPHFFLPNTHKNHFTMSLFRKRIQPGRNRLNFQLQIVRRQK
jgi:hypothetical protein